MEIRDAFARARAEKQLTGSMGDFIKHAVKMRQKGELDDAELDDLQRHLLGKVIDAMSVEETLEAKKDGRLAELEREAGHSPDRNGYDVNKTRVAIANRVAGNYISELYANGDVKAGDYIEEMRSLGFVAHDGIANPIENVDAKTVMAEQFHRDSKADPEATETIVTEEAA